MKNINAIQKIIVASALFLAVEAKAETNAAGALPVKGKTVDSEGHPIAGVTVQQYGYQRLLLNRFELEKAQEATSDANGSFELQISKASAFPQAPLFLVARKAGL